MASAEKEATESGCCGEGEGEEGRAGRHSEEVWVRTGQSERGEERKGEEKRGGEGRGEERGDSEEVWVRASRRGQGILRKFGVEE